MEHAAGNTSARLAVFSLASGHDLAARICARLGVQPGRHEEREFEDGEHKIRPLQCVRGQDVYVVQSLYGDDTTTVNDKLCRLLFFLGALRDADAARVTAVAPYLCYSRKDRRTKPRDPVTTRYVASMFEAVGVDRVVTVDVHNLAAYQNAFRIRTEHLTATRMFASYFAPLVAGQEVAVVSPDAGGVKRAERFRCALEHRIERAVGSVFLEKFRSAGVVSGSAVIGDVAGRVAIVIDDLISSGTTLVRAAAACQQRGARSVFAAATHGLFAGDAGATIAAGQDVGEAAREAAGQAAGKPKGKIDRVVVLDTVPPHRLDPAVVGDRVVVLDSAPVLAAAIRRLHDGDAGRQQEDTDLDTEADHSS